MWTIFKSLSNLLKYHFCYLCCSSFSFLLDHKTCGILNPWPGIEPAPLALEEKSSNETTMRRPGKSRHNFIYILSRCSWFYVRIINLFHIFWWLFFLTQRQSEYCSKINLPEITFTLCPYPALQSKDHTHWFPIFFYIKPEQFSFSIKNGQNLFTFYHWSFLDKSLFCLP